MKTYEPILSRTTATLLALLMVLYSPAAAAAPPTPEPQPQESLPQVFEIAWSAAPPMPQGMQDNDGGVIDNYLVMVGGFCHGFDDDWKPGKYPRGFLKKAWALNLEEESNGWFDVPDFPGSARQEMYGIAVNNEIYLWGGFNYTEPYCYRDGYKLSRENGNWNWTELPQLPRACAAGNLAAIGSNVYLIGGMDYDAERYYVWSDRENKIERFGSRLYHFDAEKPQHGWRELTACPGTPRMMSAVGVVDGQVYVIGGYAVDENGRGHDIVDSWRYDPALDEWNRLRDLPVSVSGFGAGSIVYKGRYILLLTGYPQSTILNPDGTTRPRYGKPSKVDRSGWKMHPRAPAAGYENHAWVYDTKTNLYGTATYLPFDDHCQATHIIGETVYMFPGETSGFWWEEEYFGHAPEFVLKGKIRVLDWEAN